MYYIAEAIRDLWGDRCATANPVCPTCRAWAEFDALASLSNDFRNLAAKYDQLMERYQALEAERNSASIKTYNDE